MDDRDDGASAGDGACAEGSDLPVESPLRVPLYGSQFASIPDGEYGGLCCSGVAPLQRLGQKLIALDVDANRKIRIERGGIHIGEATIGQAARGDCNHHE